LIHAVLFGATGMVGAGVLLECLDDPRVQSVLAIGRSPSGRKHPKLREVLREDFFNYDDMRSEFASCNACFFCLGVTSVGLDEAAYTHLTYDLTTAAARAMAAVNPNMTFCYVSGVGTDSTGRGRTMWARVKGKTENAILALPFKAAFMFRPAFIQPVKGVHSQTWWYQAMYTIVAPLSPAMLRLFLQFSTTTASLGRALIRVAAEGYSRPILHSRDINALGKAVGW
jgi:uncharacterized protein YbjT (DUF2867 family)